MITDNVKVFGQNSIRINSSKVIYIDPLYIDQNYNDADFIFITHDHYDHFSPNDISKIIKKDTIIVMPEKMKMSVSQLNIDINNIKYVIPNQIYHFETISFETVPSYNENKAFHPKSNNWVGYIFNLDKKYYVAGDTDNVPEIRHIDCDVAFVPIGGTYTMTYREAAELINTMRPKLVVPVHYGTIVGEKADGEKFKSLIDSSIECQIMI